MSSARTMSPPYRSESEPDDRIVPYPAGLAEQYRVAGLWAGRTIAQELRTSADRYATRTALVCSDTQLTYAELDQQTDKIAVGLRDAGLRLGERVLLQLTNQSWTVLAWYGLLKAGLVPVATLAQHRRHEILSIAAQCEPAAHLIEPAFPSQDLRGLAADVAANVPSVRLCITAGPDQADNAATADKKASGTLSVPEVLLTALLRQDLDPAVARKIVDDIQDGISPESLAVLQLSGGTTSVPKLIPRLHSEYWYNSREWASAMGLNAEGCALHMLPMVHNAGIVCALHAAHAVGAAFATCTPHREPLAAVARRYRLTHMLLTRPIAQLIASNTELQNVLRQFDVIVWADRAVPAEITEKYDSGGCRVVQMFGMGEGMCMITPLDGPPDIRHHTQGTPISTCDEVRILEPGTETPVEVGERGELCTRGPYTIRGYYRAPERNAEAFTSDGFYRTGDVVTEVRHGGRSYYRLEDRLKDLINRGGEKINAEEVEELLVRHPAVERAAVVGMPDRRLGERCCAFVVARPGQQAPDLEALKAFLDDLGVAKFKWPERVEALPELPLTNIHKVNKAKLRKEIATLVADEERAAS